jgi:glutathione synthase/RimK-type ligase-like ATP-grasp enzyme
VTGRRVAFITCSSLPDLQPDDALAAAGLARLGITVEAAVWSDPAVRWSGWDALILRSSWDYHVRAPEFLAWLESIEREGIAIWNAPATVRWNADKRYLLELSEAGIEVVPTIRLARGAGTDLSKLLESRDWRRAVVKPSISAGAHRTWVVHRSELDGARERLEQDLAAADVLIQPFLSEIQSEGEWSLVFFEGEFSHAVIKHPATGDFRVQEEFGGFAEPAPAPVALIDAGNQAIRSAPGPTLYARVDGCVVSGGFQLLELELIEPSLFLDKDPGAARRFASAIAHRLA